MTDEGHLPGIFFSFANSTVLISFKPTFRQD